MSRFALVALALAAGVAQPSAAQVMPPPHPPMAPEGTILEVVAEGAATRKPDVAVINAGVVTQAATAAEAFSRNSAQMARMLAALRQAGVAERDVQTASLGVSPQFRYAEGQPPAITGYQATNRVTVRFRDIARAGTIVDTLVQQGANSLDGPNLLVDRPEAAMDEARTAAVATARARAELYAKAAGLRVDRILSITEGSGILPPMPIVAGMRAMDASTEIAAGENSLVATVAVRFLLK